MFYTLPHKPEVIDWLMEGDSSARTALLQARLIAALKAGGYAVGSGGVGIAPEGVVVDADKDPSADWVGFNPLTFRTPEETAKEGRRVAVKAALVSLGNDATALETQTNITLRQTQLGLARTNRILETLITYLAENDIIDVE